MRNLSPYKFLKVRMLNQQSINHLKTEIEVSSGFHKTLGLNKNNNSLNEL